MFLLAAYRHFLLPPWALGQLTFPSIMKPDAPWPDFLQKNVLIVAKRPILQDLENSNVSVVCSSTIGFVRT